MHIEPDKNGHPVISIRVHTIWTHILIIEDMWISGIGNFLNAFYIMILALCKYKYGNKTLEENTKEPNSIKK